MIHSLTVDAEWGTHIVRYKFITWRVMKICKLFYLLVLLLPVLSLAEGGYISNLQPYNYSNSLYFIPVYSQNFNKPDCATRPYIRTLDEPDSKPFDRKYSLILASWMPSNKIEVTEATSCASE